MGLDEDSLLGGGDRDERPGLPSGGRDRRAAPVRHALAGAPAGIGAELGAAGLRVAYVGRDLGEGKATSVIVVPAETEGQARERIVSLLALRADEAAPLRVHPRAADDERKDVRADQRNGSRLADVEVVGDDVHVQEPQD
jgi:hypothetical protein